MRLIDAVILACGIIAAVFWVTISSKDGFKGSNAMIVARSISITSTIDGQVETPPLAVGDKVKQNDLLVRIQNGRIDRGRLIEHRSQITYLRSEIANLEIQQKALSKMLAKYEARSKIYKTWMMKDVELRRKISAREFDVATKRNQLKAGEVARAAELFKGKHTSEVNLAVAKTEAEITQNQIDLSRAQLARNELLLSSLENDGVFFENGDTSYWSKMTDSLNLRHFDNNNKIALLKAQLARALEQEQVESARIESSYSEEHRAPFPGVVNAAYTTKGTRVTSGTSLLQVIDCAHPIVIIPIPEHRIGEFSVGQKVTVYPADSEKALPGKINYISSGPLIGDDKTILVQQNMTLSGNRAIVSFDADGQALTAQTTSCDSSRKAVAIIHTSSFFDKVVKWANTYVPDWSFADLGWLEQNEVPTPGKSAPS